MKQAIGQKLWKRVLCNYLSDGNNEGVSEQALILDLPLHICLVVLDLQQSVHTLRMPQKKMDPLQS